MQHSNLVKEFINYLQRKDIHLQLSENERVYIINHNEVTEHVFLIE